MKKTIESKVWCRTQDDIQSAYEEGLNSPSPFCFTNLDMRDCGYIPMGAATIHLDLIDPKDTVAAQVEALEAQCKKVMADSEATLTMLRSKINDLLAIENSGVSDE